jgi:queuine/archaeosine tRNA-ribosyltransferase
MFVHRFVVFDLYPVSCRHNTYHYLAFFQAIRNSIKEDNFHNFRIWFTSERQDQEILALGAL